MSTFLIKVLTREQKGKMDDKREDHSGLVKEKLQIFKCS